MVRFTASAEVAAPASRVWAALVRWEDHGRWIPLTRVTVLTPSGTGVGARFVGRTGVGPVGFDDPMEITRWEPPEDARPGRCEVVKQGRVVTGSAAFGVVPLPGERSLVEWTEDVEVTPSVLTRPLAPLWRAPARWSVALVLRRMARDVEREVRGGRSD